MLEEQSKIISLDNKRNTVIELAIDPLCGLITRNRAHGGFDYSNFFLCVDDYFDNGKKWEELDLNELDEIAAHFQDVILSNRNKKKF